jgi:hypothetical protein
MRAAAIAISRVFIVNLTICLVCYLYLCFNTLLRTVPITIILYIETLSSIAK